MATHRLRHIHTHTLSLFLSLNNAGPGILPFIYPTSLTDSRLQTPDFLCHEAGRARKRAHIMSLLTLTLPCSPPSLSCTQSTRQAGRQAVPTHHLEPALQASKPQPAHPILSTTCLLSLSPLPFRLPVTTTHRISPRMRRRANHSQHPSRRGYTSPSPGRASSGLVVCSWSSALLRRRDGRKEGGGEDVKGGWMANLRDGHNVVAARSGALDWGLALMPPTDAC